MGGRRVPGLYLLSTNGVPKVRLSTRSAAPIRTGQAEIGRTWRTSAAKIAAGRSTQARKRARNHPWTPRTGQQHLYPHRKFPLPLYRQDTHHVLAMQ